MAIANVARGGAVSSSTSSATQAVTVTVATGDFVVVCISTIVAPITTAVTDNASGGSNKYYRIGDSAGSNGRVSMWICPNAVACTTITITSGSARHSLSVSTYTGVLGVGQWASTTNSANNNTITLNHAMAAGSLMLASMGDASGLQTWTAVTGTLRNNVAGAGSTTPGSTNMESTTTTCAASLSTSVSGEAIAIELLATPLPIAQDLWDSNQLLESAPPWSLGSLELYAETEQFDWGFVPPSSGQGANMMGFRGFWSLRAGMDPVEQFSFDPPEVVTPINAFDEDQYLIQTGSMQQDDDWSFNPVIVSAITAFDEDQPALRTGSLCIGTDEDTANSTFFSLEQYADDDLQSPVVASSRYQEDDVFGFQTPAVIVNLPWDTEYNPSLSTLNMRDNPEDQPSLVIAGYPQEDSPLISRTNYQYTDDDVAQATFFSLEQFGEVQEYGPRQLLSYFVPELNSDYDTAQSTFFSQEQFSDADEQFALPVNLAYHEDYISFEPVFVLADDVFPLAVPLDFDDVDQFGFQTPTVQVITAFVDELSPLQPINVVDDTEQFVFPVISGASANQNLMGFRGFWSLKAGMGSLDDWSFNTPTVIPAVSAFDQDEAPPLQAFPEVDDVDPFGFNPIIVGTGGTQLMGFRGYSIAKQGMQLDDNWSFNPPIQIITGFSEDQYPLQVVSVIHEEDTIYEPAIAQSPLDESNYDYLSNFKSLSYHDDEFSYEPALAQNPLDESTYDFINLLRSYFIPSLESDQDTSQSTFFSKEQFSDNDEQPIVTQIYVKHQDDDAKFLVFPPGILPNMFYDADFNLTLQQSYLFNSEDVEKFNWGWLPPMTKVSEDDSPYDSLMMRSFFNPSLDSDYDTVQSTFFSREQYADADEQASFRTYGWDVDEQLTYNFDYGFEDIQDKLPVQLAYQEDEPFGFQTPAVTAITSFDIDQNPVLVMTVQQDDVLGSALNLFNDEVDQFVPLQESVAEDEVWGYNPVIVGTGGTQLMGFRGYSVAKQGMQFDENWGFNPPVIPVVFADDFYQQPSNLSVRDVDEQLIFRIPDVVLSYDSEENPPFQRTFYVPEIDEDFAFISFVAPTFIPVIHSVTVDAVMGLMSTTRLRIKGSVVITPQVKVKP